jgi:hypothetical protein
MAAPFERRAITFDGKPVRFYVDAPSNLARSFLARCHGVTLTAQDEGVSEDDYVARLRDAATGMGLTATVERSDDHELVLNVRPTRR